ncbi:low-density lipoprotein receptor-related protein 11 isoform X2 [Trichosurus vulpecula]|uniref:low-density lipoprotein receptor-related protein 11 isoform X2 n=1 Tax=Trichosurus vulpecula TaxID=9337 RepID=UPI00186B28A9|nr:low-density lipoprotein receptor-related protein 11 isoform X2 [Trichosurus vulpecula]
MAWAPPGSRTRGQQVQWLGLPLLLGVWLLGQTAGGQRSAPLAELRSSISGVEELLEEFRKQLQQEQPAREPDDSDDHRERPQQRAGAEAGCPGGGYTVKPDSIIRTKDSLGAGATFLTAPAAVRDWQQCVAACCAEPLCTVAVVELPQPQASGDLNCYLFNCTYRGRNVCKFSLHRGYNSYSLSPTTESHRNITSRPGGPPGGGRGRMAAPLGPRKKPLQSPTLAAEAASAASSPPQEYDEPPHSKAGQDVVLQLPTDWVTLDGRESTDDHAIIKYEWTLQQGDSSLDMKVPQSGILKLSHLREGVYIFQLTVTDTAGQRSSDNVSVTVLPKAQTAVVSPGRKTITHAALSPAQQRTVGLTEDTNRSLPSQNIQKATRKQLLPSANADKSNHSVSQGPKNQMSALMPGTVSQQTATEPSTHSHSEPDSSSSGKDTDKKKGDYISESKSDRIGEHPLPETDSSSSGKDTDEKNVNYIPESKSDRIGEHPLPETGAVLPLALGLAITALLLLMIACRLRWVRQKLKKARPITSEESDYLINGMYL